MSGTKGVLHYDVETKQKAVAMFLEGQGSYAAIAQQLHRVSGSFTILRAYSISSFPRRPTASGTQKCPTGVFRPAGAGPVRKT